jgi:hypothetical protein
VDSRVATPLEFSGAVPSTAEFTVKVTEPEVTVPPEAAVTEACREIFWPIYPGFGPAVSLVTVELLYWIPSCAEAKVTNGLQARSANKRRRGVVERNGLKTERAETAKRVFSFFMSSTFAKELPMQKKVKQEDTIHAATVEKFNCLSTIEIVKIWGLP